MPLYEYLCSKCGEKFEVIQKFSDAPLTVHEACGGTVEKLTSAPAFHLKGSGWYATDYKSGSSTHKPESKTESKSPESKPAAETKSSETKSSETKSESKPSASTTTKTD